MFRSASMLLALCWMASLTGAVSAQTAPPAQPVPQTQPTQQAGQPAQQAQPAQSPSGLDLQVQLDRAGFSPGVIDGKPGAITGKALSAFQEAHDLPVTGKLNAETWESLAAAGTGAALVEHEITAEEANGPFVKAIPEDMEEKAKLPALGYTSIVEMLSEAFHTTPELLKKLNPKARFAAGESVQVPNIRSAPVAAEPGDVRVVVSKSNSSLTVERGGDVLFFAPVTAGSEHDPLPIGEWKVNGVAKNPTFNYNPDLFWDADPTHGKAKIPAGPNNPVGVVWVDINKPHYGIHGTPEPRMIGRSSSHGCVRLTNWDALTLAGLVRPGTPVLFEP